MIKISVDARMINSSGIGRYISALLPFLVNDGRFFINLLGRREELSEYDWRHSDNVRIIECNSNIYGLKEQWELFKKIPAHSDLFWSPHYNIPLFPAKARKRLVSIHDVFHLAFGDRLGPHQRIYARLVITAAVRLSDRVVTVSEFSRSEIARYIGIKESSIEVIPCGTDKNTFRSGGDMDSSGFIRKKYALPMQYILYVGSVRAHKNIGMLVRAFDRLLRKEAQDYKLVIVGKNEGFLSGGSDIFRLMETIPALKEKLILTGAVDKKDLPLLYTMASVFVFPSLYEGFGLPPLEAMACGCPVVVSDAASLREVCGDAAYYIDPYSLDDMARGIGDVLRDEALRKELVRKGLERVKLFNWEDSAKKLINIIMEVVSE